jgi:alpha-glucosidase (family GH31 glycosyl hydrolase)
MFDAHLQGGMVTRPLFFEYSFGEDDVILEIDNQFLVGDALMVTPVLTSGSTSVDAYVPNDLWYDYWSGGVLGKTGWTALDGMHFEELQ